jgi:hypothetical protein
MTIGDQQLRGFIYKITVAGAGSKEHSLQQLLGSVGFGIFDVRISFKSLWCLDLQNSPDGVFQKKVSELANLSQVKPRAVDAGVQEPAREVFYDVAGS